VSPILSVITTSTPEKPSSPVSYCPLLLVSLKIIPETVPRNWNPSMSLPVPSGGISTVVMGGGVVIIESGGGSGISVVAIPGGTITLYFPSGSVVTV